MMFKRALISVYDKTDLEDLGSHLSKMGTELVSTGGSAKILKAAGLKVIEVSELTGFPEVMDGRVKTLHPKIHMGLLARSGHDGDLKIIKDLEGVLFDLVVVNLYPFEETLKKNVSDSEQVEQIDIGGPTLLRAASKNFERITVLSNPSQYDLVMRGSPDLKTRRSLAAQAFSHVSSYDSLVTQFLDSEPKIEMSIGGRLVSELRYGENPHQKARWYSVLGATSGWQEAEVTQGKELSYNNLLDLDAALSCLSQLGENSCVVVKHNNPCGVATGKSLLEATDRALAADPVSCFGGIVAVNQHIDHDIANRLSELFLECVVGPSLSDEAAEVFKKKKNQRILISKDMAKFKDQSRRFISLWGGYLIQDQDAPNSWTSDWQVIGESPSEAVQKDLEFAWKVCSQLKSNAIAIASQMQTRGLGMGQVNRVDAVEQAILRTNKFHQG
ncbi:bifunctional phosphoribosylaminoimidazolecarboxamide formyltransferase/IMP cyclohydrolase, partial [bacterium]|nr:bifunctional phosphoribosylaminoimidazolecarboxamide formyltransferase/IMP cyclohydrolase [bacterium]